VNPDCISKAINETNDETDNNGNKGRKANSKFCDPLPPTTSNLPKSDSPKPDNLHHRVFGI
jgi:hypothetical protein